MTNLESAKKAYRKYGELIHRAGEDWDNLPEYVRDAWIATTNSIMADACDDVRRTLRQASRALRDEK